MGKIFRFEKDVDTDQIIASQYLLFSTFDEMKVHTFESLDPDFAANVKPGDFVVADENFGCGSSREQAPSVLKALGIKAVIAGSFARIFYRNAINIGLPVIICKDLHDAVNTGDEMELDMQEGIIHACGHTFACTKLPANMQKILDDGGLISSLNAADADAAGRTGETLDTAKSDNAARSADIASQCLMHKSDDASTSVSPMTMAEKILARAAGLQSVHAGDVCTVGLDLMMSNDGTSHITVDKYNSLKNPHIADVSKLVWIVDHNLPSDSVKTASSHKKMRDFAREHGIRFYEGEGVCHQVMIEKYVRPGQLIFGADSHTCAYGALGAFGTGVGNTDYLYAMVTGTSWVMVPETLRFNLTGKLRKGVYARDLILTIIGKISAGGANYKAMEFGGSGLASIDMAGRISICNLCVEAGAKTALMEVDDVTLSYLKEHGREPACIFTPDKDASYTKIYDIDLDTIRPIVAKPHFVDNVVPASEAAGTHIDEAFLGSCNNGRIEDLRVAADILKDHKVNDNVRFLIVPASRSVYEQAVTEGLMEIFMRAGAIIMNPNCSVCWGACQGVIGEGESLISTGTRNFKGRCGHRESFVYLASASTVTASAVTGKITTADML